MEDSHGYKWVATDYGLSRFDGKRFELIDRNDSTGIRFCNSMLNGPGKRLLFGYHDGSIKSFNGVNLQTIYRPKPYGSPVKQMLNRDSSSTWALTQNDGIIKLEVDSAILLKPEALISKKANTFLIVDNQVLIGTNEGLTVFRITDNETLDYRGEIEELETRSVEGIERGQDEGVFWLATDGGIFKMENLDNSPGEVSAQVRRLDFLQDKKIVSVVENNEKDLWIGTKYSGLIRINFNRQNSRPIQFSYLDKANGFPGNQTSTLYLDKDNNVWVGTIGDGLIQVARKGVLFYNFEAFRARSVQAISGTRNHEFLFGTDVGIIQGYYTGDADSLNFKLVDHVAVRGKNVTAIHTDSKDLIYFAIENEGIFYADPSFKTVTKIPFNELSEDLFVRQIVQDEDGNLWLPVKNKGVFVIDISGNVINHLATTTGFYHNEIYHIHIDSKNNKWFAAHGSGLAVMKPNGEMNYLSKEGIFPARDVNDISEDESGNIWIGTYGNGVFEYDGENFIQFTTEDGLLSNYCNAVVSDKNNHIWLSHRVGLSRIDEYTGAISSIEEKDGLVVTEFIFNSIYQDQDHNIWLGNRNGVTFLSTPDEMFEPQMIKPVITDIKINLQPADLYVYSSDEVINGKIPEDLTFPYDVNKLTFEYIAINLKNPESNLYQFKLSGYEEEWSPPTRDLSITYTNLKSGDYAFMVRQSDNPNHWSENATMVSFTVTPPWWSTWWAITLFALATIVMVYGVIHIRTNRLQKRLEEKKRFLEIMEDKNKRLKEFSFIMSHNTRSSVGNIIGLINLLAESPNNKTYYDMLKVSANKLDLTVKHINDLLNMENETQDVVGNSCDVSEAMNRVISLNTKMIEKSKADIEVDIKPDTKVKAIPAYLDSILNNLLVNAIRYGTTADSKKIMVYADVSPFETIVTFKDWGIGLDLKKYKGKLFKLGSRFHSEFSDGHGLGLFMCKSQLDSMDGRIDIQSKVDEGTTVKIQLPTA